jgi:Ca2+-binding EF-hand superfamily protein
MKEPLIGLGFANTTKEVEHMIELVDEDGSGMIEFNEFLSIIQDSGENEKTKLIRDFFKDLAQGNLGTKDVSFPLFVCKIRRKHLMDAIYSKEEDKKS